MFVLMLNFNIEGCWCFPWTTHPQDQLAFHYTCPQTDNYLHGALALSTAAVHHTCLISDSVQLNIYNGLNMPSQCGLSLAVVLRRTKSLLVILVETNKTSGAVAALCMQSNQGTVKLGMG